MSVFFDNFNYDPINNVETSASYTVPAGGYAIVSVTLSVSIHATGNGTVQDIIAYGGSESATVELKLQAGETLTHSTVTGNNNINLGVSQRASLTSTAFASVLINGTSVSTIRTAAFVLGTDTGAGTGVINTTGLSTVSFHVAEYNKQGN